MNKLKESVFRSMQSACHEIKYHKMFIESSVRRFREKTKGDVWTEMIDWYDYIKELEFACAEIRRALFRYHDMHDVAKYIDEHKNDLILEAKHE